MDGKTRREKLVDILLKQTDVISGTKLAQLLGVSRQIIVQDIALIRAENYSVYATPKGYRMSISEEKQANRYFKVKHTTEEIEDELMTIIHEGGRVLNVIVKHPVYGTIATELIINTEKDVLDFVEKVMNQNSIPLKELTNNIHTHKVEAVSEAILDKIEDALKEKKYLIS